MVMGVFFRKNIDFAKNQSAGKSGQALSVTETRNASISAEKIDIGRYKDPAGLTLQKMSIGLWLVANRKNFRALLIIFLSLIIAFCAILFVYSFGRQIFFGMKADRNIFLGMSGYNRELFENLKKNPLKDLVFSPPEAIKTGDNRYDFYVKASNPNERHWAHFSYVFSVNGEKTRSSESFILPGESKYLILLGEDLRTAGRAPSFAITDILWQEIDFQRYPNWKNYVKDRLNVAIDGINYIPSQSGGLSEKISINTLDFNAANNTAFNYWDFSFMALLFDGDRVVGVNRYTVDRFYSGQKRSIGITWPEEIGRVSDVLVVPEIDITRDDIYIRFDGGVGEEK